MNNWTCPCCNSNNISHLDSYGIYITIAYKLQCNECSKMFFVNVDED